MRLRFEPLGEHDRAAFSCGAASIDRFLKSIARQRQERRLATTLVAVDADGDTRRVVGFYTIIPHEFRGEELPDPFRRGARVGKLSVVPGALLAQLGVDVAFQGAGVGKTVVRHALVRVAGLAEQWGCAAVVADPIDERARQLYRGFDFVPLPGQPSRMIVTTKTVLAALHGMREDAALHGMREDGP